MSKERIEKLINGILDLSNTLGESMNKAEDKIVEGVGIDVKKTIKVLEVLERFNKTRMENIMTINKASRAKQLIQIVDEEGGKMYRVEGRKKGKDEWELIVRVGGEIKAETMADKYRKEYAAVRIVPEVSGGEE